MEDSAYHSAIGPNVSRTIDHTLVVKVLRIDEICLVRYIIQVHFTAKHHIFSISQHFLLFNFCSEIENVVKQVLKSEIEEMEAISSQLASFGAHAQAISSRRFSRSKLLALCASIFNIIKARETNYKIAGAITQSLTATHSSLTDFNAFNTH